MTDNLSAKPADRQMPAGKVWLASKYVNKITRRALNRHERRNPDFYLHDVIHDTWEDAHAFILRRREEGVKKAAADLVNARRSLERARAMKCPEVDLSSGVIDRQRASKGGG